MKIKGIKRLGKDEYPKEVQGWIEILLTPLNEVLDSVVNALRGKLTASDNFLSETKEFTFTHDTYLTNIKHNLNKVYGLNIVKPPDKDDDNYIITSHHWYTVDNENIALKVLFNGGAATEGKVKFEVKGE